MNEPFYSLMTRQLWSENPTVLKNIQNLLLRHISTDTSTDTQIYL